MQKKVRYYNSKKSIKNKAFISTKAAFFCSKNLS